MYMYQANKSPKWIKLDAYYASKATENEPLFEFNSKYKYIYNIISLTYIIFDLYLICYIFLYQCSTSYTRE